MNRADRQRLLVVRYAIDIVLVMAAWVIAYYLRFYTGFYLEGQIPDAKLYFKLLPFIAVIWSIIFVGLGLYRRTGRHRSSFIEGLDIIQCAAMATMAFIAFTYYYEEYRYSRITVFIFSLLQPILIISGRSIIRKSLRRYRRLAQARQVLIIGSGDGIERIWDIKDGIAMERSEVIGAVVVGEPDDCAKSRAFCKAHSIPLLPLPEDWAAFFTAHATQTVFIALAQGTYTFIEGNLDKIADQVPDVKIVPDFSKFVRFSSGVEVERGLPMFSIHESPLVGMGSVAKRLLDLLGSLAAIILLAPVMTIIAIFVRLSSPGPVLFRQERMGLDGRVFHCLKFRSMPMDAEKHSGPVWAKAGENRATRVGGFLRRTSLDELPQFFNVLKGDMSLVGPRPERPFFVHQFRTQVPGYMLRHKVRAGITGWAQVNGWRGNTSIEKRIECDLFYIQNWSLWLDIKILLMTVEEVLLGRNAH